MPDVWSLYSEKVMEHFKNPRNVGEMENPDGIGYVGNPVCGDIMELYIKVKDGIIVDAKFKTFGCGAAIATSSMVTEIVKGKSIKEALKISNKTVAEALDGLPAIKMHCSVLAEEALKSAIEDYLNKSKEKGKRQSR
jgi:nitrogen fixation NifU-like protein